MFSITKLRLCSPTNAGAAAKGTSDASEVPQADGHTAKLRLGTPLLDADPTPAPAQSSRTPKHIAK